MQLTRALMVAAGLLVAQYVYAEDTQDEHMMRVCVDNYPPFQILEPDRSPIGEHVAALELFASLLQRRLVFVSSPNFARCLHMLEQGSVDVLAGIYAKPERAAYSYFLPYRNDGRFVFISQKALANVNDYEDLTTLDIGVSRETEYFDRFDSDARLHKVQTNDVISATNMLLKGRFDLLIVSEVVLPSLRARFGDFDDKLRVHPYTHEEHRQVYFGVSKRHQMGIPLSKMQAIIGQAYEEGRFMQVVEEFAKQHLEHY
ncbi:transporter substrate-binding domain-containing protein [Shewanella sp. JBTF-M18]|uniref:Transporter substrate-binding domain-containing protein n=1 Tax=Shewanella insulae TaxID=2681496 RepID=A0A6L7HWS8_9GAMM|nr:transporter substrate-binding domain-containing protein [Shewanella insulae]MXR68470.1 transporter substrate-binding domain-containing protein [Shewanella insulae]